MNKKEDESSLLAYIAAVVALLVVSFMYGYRPGDFIIPPQFARAAERFAGKCQTSSSGCRATLKDGSVARVSYNMTIAGPQILIYSQADSEENTPMGLGKFLREGGFFVFDTLNFYR